MATLHEVQELDAYQECSEPQENQSSDQNLLQEPIQEPIQEPTCTSNNILNNQNNQTVGIDIDHLNEANTIVVMLEGLPFYFSLDLDDISGVMECYGVIKKVEYLDKELSPDILLIEFDEIASVEKCVLDLNDMIINVDGEICMIKLSPYNSIKEKIYEIKEIGNQLKERRVHEELRLRNAESNVGDPYFNFNGGNYMINPNMIHDYQSGSVPVNRTNRQYPNRHASDSHFHPMTPAGKWCARFVIGAERMTRDFPIVGRIIGPCGEHMKQIHQQTGAKLRLRGRRSNYREGPDNRESDEPLHLCVSSNDEASYKVTCEYVEKLMQGVYADYGDWCIQKGIPVPPIQMIMAEGSTLESLDQKLEELYASQEYVGDQPICAPEEGIPRIDNPDKRMRFTNNMRPKNEQFCRHWPLGKCHFGASCSFRHI